MNLVVLTGKVLWIGDEHVLQNGRQAITIGIKYVKNFGDKQYDRIIKAKAFGYHVDFIKNNIKENDYVCITGELTNSKSTTQSGDEYYETSIYITNVESSETKQGGNEQYRQKARDDGYIDVNKTPEGAIKELLKEDDVEESLPF